MRASSGGRARPAHSLARAVSGSAASFRTSTSAIAPREVPTNGWSLSEGMNPVASDSRSDRDSTVGLSSKPAC